MFLGPAQCFFDLVTVDGISAVVSGTVLHEGDQISIPLDLQVALKRMHLFQQVADIFYDLKVLFFAFTADIVGFSRDPFQQDQPDRFTVVVDIEPVPHIFPVAVDRKVFAFDGIEDHERDELFRELVRPVIVRAVRQGDRHSVGVVIGPDDMVRRRL